MPKCVFLSLCMSGLSSVPLQIQPKVAFRVSVFTPEQTVSVCLFPNPNLYCVQTMFSVCVCMCVCICVCVQGSN